MRLKLHAARCPRLLALVIPCLLFARAATAQSGCPAAAGVAVDRGWAALRTGDAPGARAAFASAIASCPALADPHAGLGFSYLRLDDPGAALAEFDRVLALDSLHADGWYGRAASLDRMGRGSDAAPAARRALSLAPGYAEARTLLDRIEPGWNRAPLAPPPRPAVLQVPARAREDRLEVRIGGGWRPLLVRGVNLGAALPGRFPAEFPTDSAVYAGWLEQMAAMHANAVRIYTILPPEFYRALRGHNLAHAGSPLHLLQGVWAELPPADDFTDARWLAAFQREMRDAVDLVHGGLKRAARPGHAGGQYDADVSSWTLGYILGREWEPYAVEAFDQATGAIPATDRFVTAAGGATRMERWLAAQADLLLAHEFDRWHTLRPVAFTNWPTLDPLHHPTEASAHEEAEWRRAAGRPLLTNRREYDNDGVSLDPGHLVATDSNPAGVFAAYHAYPYYPDFMNLDPGYAGFAARTGKSNYAGYLEELVTHHAGMPVLIAEVGLPSSRGRAHWQPQGLTHGGLDEREQAEGTIRLVQEIEASGAAGSVIFAWIDEWFKHNWVTIDLETPPGHNPRWLNVEDAEQQYGILGLYPGSLEERPVPGGPEEAWRTMAPVATSHGGLQALRLGADEGWLYLAVDLDSATANTAAIRFAIGIDVVRPDLGQTHLPGGIRSEVGFEFLVDLDGAGRGALLALPEYNPYVGAEALVAGDDQGRFHRRPLRPVRRDDNRWDSLTVVINRARFARDGTFTRARLWDRGRLRPTSGDSSSLADWRLDRRRRLLVVRLPWALLNVTDPSTGQVAFEFAREGEYGTVTTDGFRVGVIALVDGRAVATLPQAERGRWRSGDFDPWRWPGWTTPRYHQALKPVYFALRDLWSAP